MKSGFTQWMAEVDEYIAVRYMGVDSNDLPDQNYRDWFDDGLSSTRAAKRAIRYAEKN
jgi:Family of unknown function (DUF5419)